MPLIIEFQKRENIVILSPEGAIGLSDIDSFTEQMNTYINDTDQVPNIVIHAKKAPHWENVKTMKEHLGFVKSRHKLVEKIAIVSDSKMLWMAKSMVGHFVHANVRSFNEGSLLDAISWAQEDTDHPGDIVEIEGYPRDVIALDFKGLITSQDYTNTLIPLVEAAEKDHDSLKLLCVMGTYFDGFSAGAMRQDMRFGFAHVRSFSKIALVSDKDWIRNGVKAFGLLMPADVVVFDLDEFDDAAAWIRE